MDPILLGGLLGGGAGLLKSLFGAGDVDKYNDLQAQTARYSPWTGMKPQNLKGHGFVDNTLQGGLTGAAVGQSVAGLSKAPAAVGGLTYPTAGTGSIWDSMAQQPNRFNLGTLGNGSGY